MYRGDCYPNGSYINGGHIYSYKENNSVLKCASASSTLNGGEWVTPSGSSVDCSTDPLRCNVVISPASLGLFIPTGLYIPASDDGWYKCCLPTNCSDPNTDIINVNIFGM